MKKCPSCGRLQSDDAVFCSKCGSSFNTAGSKKSAPDQAPKQRDDVAEDRITNGFVRKEENTGITNQKSEPKPCPNPQPRPQQQTPRTPPRAPTSIGYNPPGQTYRLWAEEEARIARENAARERAEENARKQAEEQEKAKERAAQYNKLLQSKKYYYNKMVVAGQHVQQLEKTKQEAPRAILTSVLAMLSFGAFIIFNAVFPSFAEYNLLTVCFLFGFILLQGVAGMNLVRPVRPRKVGRFFLSLATFGGFALVAAMICMCIFNPNKCSKQYAYWSSEYTKNSEKYSSIENELSKFVRN